MEFSQHFYSNRVEIYYIQMLFIIFVFLQANSYISINRYVTISLPNPVYFSLALIEFGFYKRPASIRSITVLYKKAVSLAQNKTQPTM